MRAGEGSQTTLHGGETSKRGEIIYTYRWRCVQTAPPSAWLHRAGGFRLQALNVIRDGMIRGLLVTERVPEGDHGKPLRLMLGEIHVVGTVFQHDLRAKMLVRPFVQNRKNLERRQQRYGVLVVHESQQRE